MIPSFKHRILIGPIASKLISTNDSNTIKEVGGNEVVDKVDIIERDNL